MKKNNFTTENSWQHIVSNSTKLLNPYNVAIQTKITSVIIQSVRYHPIYRLNYKIKLARLRATL